MRFNKLFLPIGLLAIGVLWGACVDVPDGPGTVTNPDFRSQVRFFHAVPGGAAGNVSVDGSSVGNIGYLASTSYSDIPSGSRSVAFGATSAQSVVLGSEQQSTVLIYSTGGTALAYLNLPEGHKDKNNASATSAKIKYVNAAFGSSANIVLRSGSATGTDLAASVPFAGARVYDTLSAGSIAIFAVSAGSYKATLNGSQEPTPVATSATGTAAATIGNNKNLTYSVTVDIDSITGFYTMAHFHNAPAGVNGPVVKAIFTDTTGQRITLPNTSLSGANEPTPVTTASSGAARFILSPQGLTYSITVTKGAPDTLGFTAAHFHNAAAGTNGSVVRTIAGAVVTDSTLSGVWRTDDAVQPLTPALMTELVNGRIYVNFQSAPAPGGTIRAQVVPDKKTTFTGTWVDTTGLTDALRQEFNAGNIYVNFHSNDYPGGKIRGQVQVDASSFGVATLPATNFEVGKLYTLVATGAGSALQLTVLQDRQVAGPPVGKPAGMQVKK